jgi:hypothetical protein
MLPRYTKQYEDQDPLLPTPGDGQGRESTETAPPTYPPAGPSTADGRHNVEYSYFPVYPRKGKTEHVVGILGNTKQVSISLSGKRVRWGQMRIATHVTHEGAGNSGGSSFFTSVSCIQDPARYR